MLIYSIIVHISSLCVMYTCYFLDQMTLKIMEMIKEKMVITFPMKHKLNIGDVILLYIKNGNKSGFIGYVKIFREVSNNYDEKGDIVIDIFGNSVYDKYKSSISYVKIVKNARKIKTIVESKEYVDEFLKFKKRKTNGCLKKMNDTLGKMIRVFLHNHGDDDEKIPECTESEMPKLKPIPKPIMKEKKHIIKSKYLIPILLVPCDDFKETIEVTEHDKKSEWVYNHIIHCRGCNITNNNDRISIDTLKDINMSFHKMRDVEDIGKLLTSYHMMDYYNDDKMETTNIKLIKVIYKRLMYDKCYFIIGRLNEKR